jgi:hypothetical protein
MVRTCSTCGFIVTNVSLIYCPRCNTTLCKIERSCDTCVSLNGCSTIPTNLEDNKDLKDNKSFEDNKDLLDK